MDEYLDDSWQIAAPPFHGATVRNERSIARDRLLRVMTTVTDWLESRYGRAAKLLMLDDWHEHDGFRVTGARIEWTALRAMMSDELRFARTCTAESNVYRAVYPIPGDWLVRWYIDDENPAECEFTFSASEQEARELADALRPLTAVSVHESAAYFRKRYAG